MTRVVLLPFLLAALLAVSLAAQDAPADAAASAIPSPESFFGYALGERYTEHSSVLAYLRALDRARATPAWSSPSATVGRTGATIRPSGRR